jgi:hypothetical protein
MAAPVPPGDEDGDIVVEPAESGSNPLWIVLGRTAVVAAVVVAVHFSLREWHGATMVAMIVGAAWLLGRVD